VPAGIITCSQFVRPKSPFLSVGPVLLKTLGQGLGNELTQDVNSVWTNVYGVMADVMKAAAKQGASLKRDVPLPWKCVLE
jgi:hemoglobin-like flavoprotein